MLPRKSSRLPPQGPPGNVADLSRPPDIFVLAGVNGAGKSSIIGSAFLQRGQAFFNPDEATKQIRAANPGSTLEAANSAAWLEGKRLLQLAIGRRLEYAFETTLGGNTITGMLASASADGIAVRIWYVGLNSPDLHIARVKSSVAKGGHHIPREKIIQRYDQSRLNLIQLLPKLAELKLFDNSVEGDPSVGPLPPPRLILHMDHCRIVKICGPRTAPGWTKPILAAALSLQT